MCRLCKDYKDCKNLCQKVEALLINSKKNNGIYADSTEDSVRKVFDANILDKILYTTSLNEVTYTRSKSIIIAILSPEQKEILSLYSKGYSQDDIAGKLGITQSGVSQKIKAIKNNIREQFVKVIDIII